MNCPICHRETDPKYRPFCSRRCADVDLGNWLKGAYAIPAAEEDTPDPETDTPRSSPRRPH